MPRSSLDVSNWQMFCIVSSRLSNARPAQCTSQICVEDCKDGLRKEGELGTRVSMRVQECAAPSPAASDAAPDAISGVVDMIENRAKSEGNLRCGQLSEAQYEAMCVVLSR